ncbi:hypothetical protein BCR41DRAFT_358682, partial [Lobosporangium transversale]
MMGNPKVNPLDISEIVLHVGDFLERDALLRCIRISRTFHDTLVKSIWKKITIEAHARYPTGEALQNYKKYIEELKFNESFSEEYLSLQGCSRLRSIECSGVWSSPSPDQVFDLIKPHSSTITKLSFKFSNLRNKWGTLLGCTRLEALDIYHTHILEDEFAQFFQICHKVRWLHLSGIKINQFPLNFLDDDKEEYIFLNMTTLRLYNVEISNPPHPHTSSYCLGILTKRCPGLRSLEFFYYREDTQTTQQMDITFYRTALLHHPYTLTNLSDVYFPLMKITDEEMATLLKKMTSLRRLEVPDCDFGPLSIRELLADEQEVLDGGRIVRQRRDQRLCDTVEIVKVNQQSKRTDGVAQVFLSNCPRLKRLYGPKITVTEVVGSAEWVSTGLTKMMVRLVVDVDPVTKEGKEKGRIVYDRICNLARLDLSDLTYFSGLLSFARINV